MNCINSDVNFIHGGSIMIKECTNSDCDRKPVDVKKDVNTCYCGGKLKPVTKDSRKKQHKVRKRKKERSTHPTEQHTNPR